MRIQNTEAIVIKRKASGDSSLIIHVITENEGKLILVAKGARGPKSKWRGHLEPYNHVNIHFYEKKDRPYQILSAAESLNSFNNLKKRPQDLLYAAVILEILDRTQLQQGDPLVYKLLLHILRHLEEGRVEARYLHWYFILIFLKLNGFAINSDRCARCSDPLEDAVYSPVDANLYCRRCHGIEDPNCFLHPNAVEFLRHMIANKVPGLQDVTMDDHLKDQFDTLFWHAAAVHFDELRFLNSIKILKLMD